MKFKEALELAVTSFKDKIEQDSKLYNSITKRLFKHECKWNAEMLARMEASFVSSQKTDCIPGKSGCQVVDEEGYEPLEFLICNFRNFLELYTRTSHNKQAKIPLDVLERELKILYKTIKSLMHRIDPDNSMQAHIEFMLSKLKKLKGVFCYQSGIPGHSIYINYFWKGSKLIAVIYNLGLGLEHHDSYGKLILPKTLIIEDIQKHITTIYNAKMDNRKLDKKAKKELLSTIYSSGKNYNDFEVGDFEYAQTTGNCVVKNWMHALNGRISSENYKAMIFGLLSVIKSHYKELNKNIVPIRDVTHLNARLIASQKALGGYSCDDINKQLTIYTSNHQTTTQKVGSPENTAAAGALGASVGAMGGAFVMYKAVQNSDMSDFGKFVVSLAGGIAGGLVGHELGKTVAPQKWVQVVHRGLDIQKRGDDCLKCSVA